MPRQDENEITLQWLGRDDAVPAPCPLPFTPAEVNTPGRLYHADNLDVMRHLAHEAPGSIDLAYIDPPFNTGKQFSLSGDSGHAYSDHHGGLAGYLSAMLPRLRLIHLLLAPRGTLYLHCDYRVSSHLRLLLDEIFGGENLRGQIIWHYQSGGRTRRTWSMKHDVIWMYSRSAQFTFNFEAVAVRRGPIPRNHMKQVTTPDGKSAFTIRSNGRIYTYSEDDLLTPADVWTDISHLQQKDPERTGYATQKPAKLLERIIAASSNEGELVADFYCGSGTTLAVADAMKRRWIGCDSGDAAIALCQKRLAPSLLAPLSFTLLTPSANPARHFAPQP